MTQSQDPIAIHPSVITSAEMSVPVSDIPICFTLKKEEGNWYFSAQDQGSLQDLCNILEKVIEAANESCSGQYSYKLADSNKHVWRSFTDFDDDIKRDFNEIAVFCCPLSYLQVHNGRKPLARDAMKLFTKLVMNNLMHMKTLSSFMLTYPAQMHGMKTALLFLIL